MSFHTTAATTDIYTLARRRAGAKIGFYIHATVYILVNLFLIYLATSHDRTWYLGPLLGWGLGLAIHGFKVFMVSPGSAIYDRMVENERKKLAL